MRSLVTLSYSATPSHVCQAQGQAWVGRDLLEPGGSMVPVTPGGTRTQPS